MLRSRELRSVPVDRRRLLGAHLWADEWMFAPLRTLSHVDNDRGPRLCGVAAGSAATKEARTSTTKDLAKNDVDLRYASRNDECLPRLCMRGQCHDDAARELRHEIGKMIHLAQIQSLGTRSFPFQPGGTEHRPTSYQQQQNVSHLPPSSPTPVDSWSIHTNTALWNGAKDCCASSRIASKPFPQLVEEVTSICPTHPAQSPSRASRQERKFSSQMAGPTISPLSSPSDTQEPAPEDMHYAVNEKKAVHVAPQCSLARSPAPFLQYVKSLPDFSPPPAAARFSCRPSGSGARRRTYDILSHGN